MKLDILHDLANKIHQNTEGTLRIGQCYMNALSVLNHALYQKITATENDPFYVDEKVPQFLEFVAKEWGDNADQ